MFSRRFEKERMLLLSRINLLLLLFKIIINKYNKINKYIK